MCYQQNTKDDGTDYYEILLVYVEDVLACNYYAKAVMAGISAKFEIKNDDIAETKLYLGGNVDKSQLPNGKYAWSITSNSYLQGAIYNVQRILDEDDRTLNTGKRPQKGPLIHGYMPELDTTYG